MANSLLSSLILVCCTLAASGFGIIPSSRTRSYCDITVTTRPLAFGHVKQRSSFGTLLFMADTDEAAARKKRRRRRKEEGPVDQTEDTTVVEMKEPEPEPPTPKPMPAVVPRAEFEVVEVAIRDVRNVGGENPTLDMYEDEEEYEDDEDYYEDDDDEDFLEENVSRTTTTMISGESGSMESLLADAKRLRAAKATPDNEQEGAIGETVKNIISTIVTVDFFVVCALLLWFIAGIFCSYILKDDTVQIAFNKIFESVVQPALGILMIAAVAGAVMNQGDKDEDES